ncbi:argininosuccinate lyase [Helicobacter muridarum]|uniref:Argininosuccinate lyase n=1 Tax=Helicobacter muridarum TaxID=216 RepID=A0A099TYG9_9HELI|nr:argininosuccinate lyase [Helicobacter muridarum]TLD99014.1 argininosuccinate lyase [Helicobacter muridarum]STQ85420.1 argininosuccinate lyase [Helicobacter muridarum]
MAKLWGGRFNESMNELLERFNASITFDKNLWEEDIQGSMEHAKMLYSIGLLEVNELDLILNGLREISSEIIKDKFSFSLENEDIHTAIENELCKKIGQAGKKLHTARSRNDQVALDFMLYCRKANIVLQGLLGKLIQTLLNIAKQHTHTLMPGMTHLQHAQPINFGYHIVAWCMGFKRDIQRLRNSLSMINECPLGSAALAGTPYKNERENLALGLGFESASLNAMDSVAQRDFALDLLYDISMIMLHISRLAEELIIWSSYEFGFVAFADDFATGSSIMPQKKNPDVAELLRGKCGRAYGNLIALLTTMKSLPFAYNKDMQEDKESVFDSVQTAHICLEILNASLKTLHINKENMRKMCEVGHLVATDLADFLVQELGIPFREAHHVTGICVRYAEKEGLDLSQVDIQDLQALLVKELGDGVAINIDKLSSALNLEDSMQRRNSIGGCNSDEVKRQIHVLETWLDI